MIFDAVQYAKDELVPTLRIASQMTEEGDQERESAFLRGVLAGIERAREPDDLADPLMLLSTAAFQGFEFEASVVFLLDQVLEKAQRLASSLADEPQELH